MAAKDNRRSILNQVVDGRQSFRDPAIIGDHPIFKRHIEIAANEYTLTINIKVADGLCLE